MDQVQAVWGIAMEVQYTHMPRHSSNLYRIKTICVGGTWLILKIKIVGAGFCS